MNCLAVVGAGIEKLIESFKAINIFVIDSCPVDCGKKIMNKHGINNYKYLCITDLDYKKGKTQITEEVIKSVCEKAEVIY